MGQLDGKVAMTTGGAAGIGAACCRAFAREGAKVVVADIDRDGGEALAAELAASGAEAVFVELDVADEAAWLRALGFVADTYGRLDVAVANAGIALSAPVEDMSLANWRRQMNVNVDGVFLSVKHSIPLMRRSGGGSIVIMSSIAGQRGSVNFSGYSASKAAVRYFAKTVALECAAKKDNIRVNTVHPGPTATEIFTKMTEGGGVDSSRFLAEIPFGRFATTRDIANGVLFLASDASSYMTGAELVLDGGQTAGRLR